jgi:tetratricopeptide (TPR) repeat protein
VAEDLAALLVSGERAAFHGRPAAGVEPLRSAVAAAQEAGLGEEAAAAGWLLGVCLVAAGRYGEALDVLGRVAEPSSDAGGADAGAGREVFAALADATLASVHRQLGRHEPAREHDQRGLGRASGSAEATFDCRLGLAADAVGLGDAAAAGAEIEQAAALVEGRADWWRQRVRLGWLTAEYGLLTGAATESVTAAQDAVELAERSGAPRHVAKGLLFLGVALIETGRIDEAVTALRRGSLLAESLGCIPLQWPTRAMLGALLAENAPAESERCFAAAKHAIGTLSDSLPADLRDQWRARPDVSALLDS